MCKKMYIKKKRRRRKKTKKGAKFMDKSENETVFQKCKRGRCVCTKDQMS